MASALFPALGGYLFLQVCNATRPRFQHVPGYHLIFASALAGGVFYAAAFTAVAWLDLGDARVVSAALDHGAIAARYGTAIAAAVLSLCLALAFAQVANLFVTRETANHRAAVRAGRLREILLRDAMRRSGLVEISLRTGKSYVALVQEIAVTQPRDSDVLLIPVLSGYRDPETRRLRLPTNYFPTLERLGRDGMTRALPIAVPLSEVVSARPFDLEIWDEFHAPVRSGPGRNSTP